MNLFPSFIGFSGLLFLGLLIPIALLALLQPRLRHQILFPFLVGSTLSFLILRGVDAIRTPGDAGNAFFLGLGILLIIVLWKFLFGPWDAKVKATVLGIFIFWIAVQMGEARTTRENIAMALAAMVAAVPAAIWCLFFLRYHMQKLSVVFLTFFAGMLSTAPILFYDAVVRSGVELHFFLFRVTPENFLRSSRTFVSQSLTGESGILTASVAVTLVSFVLVGVIEEWSKNWVIRKSDPAYFHSVNDVIQLSIVAAIGFAFAENIVNPNYFLAFVQNYLITPASPRWGVFLGSVFGRSIITNMVHITCSGVLGYFYGLAFFSKYMVEDDRAHGRRHPLVIFFHRITGASRIRIYRELSMVLGLFFAITLHAAFDVAVSLPETLPGHPQTLGELFGFTGSLSGISLILFPAVLYVVGGLLLLSFLLHRKKDLHVFGSRFQQEVFLPTGSAV